MAGRVDADGGSLSTLTRSGFLCEGAERFSPAARDFILTAYLDLPVMRKYTKPGEMPVGDRFRKSEILNAGTVARVSVSTMSSASWCRT